MPGLWGPVSLMTSALFVHLPVHVIMFSPEQFSIFSDFYSLFEIYTWKPEMLGGGEYTQE